MLNVGSTCHWDLCEGLLPPAWPPAPNKRSCKAHSSVLQFLLWKRRAGLCSQRQRSFLRVRLFASERVGKSPVQQGQLGAPSPRFERGRDEALLPPGPHMTVSSNAAGMETSCEEHCHLLLHGSPPLPVLPCPFLLAGGSWLVCKWYQGEVLLHGQLSTVVPKSSSPRSHASCGVGS